MTEADHKPIAQLPPKSPEWMRAAVGKPFEELPDGLQRWIEDNEVDVHFRFAQDIKHCEADLVQLAGQRGRLSFKDFEAARSSLEMRIDAARSQQKRLVDAEQADRLLVLAWIIEGRKSASAEHQAVVEDARPAPPPAEAVGERVTKMAFNQEEGKAQPPAKSTRGRDYRPLDAPLVAEMQALIRSGNANSPEDAARSLVSRAAGNGTEDSKVARLAKRCREAESSKS